MSASKQHSSGKSSSALDDPSAKGGGGDPDQGIDQRAIIQAVTKSLATAHHHQQQHHHHPTEVSTQAVEPEDSVAAEASSSTSSVVGTDPKILRGYCWSPPLQWSTFLRLRRTWGDIALSPQQEDNVFKALEKMVDANKAHETLPFVSAFIDKHCPELRHKGGMHTPRPRPGATFLILAVITGNARLCRRCLELGANPNNTKFLSDPDVAEGQMNHGYSAMFLACICEQLEVMQLLRDHGGSIHVVDRWGRTPLHAAASMGSMEVLKWLLREGAPRKVVDVDLQMPGGLCVGKVIPSLSQTPLLFLTPQSATQAVPTSSGSLPPSASIDVNLLCSCCRELVKSKIADGSFDQEYKDLQPAARTPVTYIGRCGCVDDMYTRWYADRLTSRWSTAFPFVRDQLQNNLMMGPPPQQAQQQQPAQPTTMAAAAAAAAAAEQ